MLDTYRGKGDLASAVVASFFWKPPGQSGLHILWMDEKKPSYLPTTSVLRRERERSSFARGRDSTGPALPRVLAPCPRLKNTHRASRPDPNMLSELVLHTENKCSQTCKVLKVLKNECVVALASFEPQETRAPLVPQEGQKPRLYSAPSTRIRCQTTKPPATVSRRNWQCCQLSPPALKRARAAEWLKACSRAPRRSGPIR